VNYLQFDNSSKKAERSEHETTHNLLARKLEATWNFLLEDYLVYARSLSIHSLASRFSFRSLNPFTNLQLTHQAQLSSFRRFLLRRSSSSAAASLQFHGFK